MTCISINEEADASWILSQEIQLMIDVPNEEQIQALLALWDNDYDWDDIIAKFQTEGSKWIVWWHDGVRAFMKAKAA